MIRITANGLTKKFFKGVNYDRFRWRKECDYMTIITIILSLVAIALSLWSLAIVNDCMALARKITLTVSQMVLDKGDEVLRKSRGDNK